MRLNKLHITLLLTVCAALAACTDEVSSIFSPENGKTPIELTVGGVDVQDMSRAVITNDPGKTYNPFNKDTKIFMVMKSTYGTSDYQGSHKDKYTVARGDVTASNNKVTFDNLNQKYWDDAHARSSMLDIWAYAAMVPATWNDCSFQVPNQSWDGEDPLEEYRKETFYTGTQAADKSPYPWIEHDFSSGDKGHLGAIYPCIMEWKVTHTPWTQTANSIQYQDLMFSNNLADNSANGGTDSRLKFGTQTAGKFNTGEMKFYHAMSKITINVIEGDGFIKDGASKESDFQFKSETNIKLIGFNTQGTFNIKNGYFEKVEPSQEITSIALTSPKGVDPQPYYALQALAIPNIYGINGSTDSNSRFESSKNDPETDTMMEFTIDNNTYKVTSKQLYDALHGKDGATEATTGIIPLEAGKNYVFKFKVSKSKISEITAQIADWEVVNAEQILPSNARINLKLEERGTDTFAEESQISLYRAEDNPTEIKDDHKAYNWGTGYTSTGNSTTLTKTGSTWNFPVGSPWFWPNNKTYYHFRILYPTTKSVNTADSKDYTTLTSAKVFEDVIWGAPMLDNVDDENNPQPGSFKWTYSDETGFDVTNASLESGNHQIYHAIGPTESTVKLILFHMMSDVKFTITTNDDQLDEVTLGNGSNDDNKTTLELVNYYNGGKLLLGNGLVQTTGEVTTTELGKIYASDDHNHLSYGIVPQSLDGVELHITTPDHNKYIVDLKDIFVTSVPSTTNIANPYGATSGKYYIDRWYPGFKYNYTLKLTKKGIENITATILQWEEVTAGNDNVQIK